MDLSDNIEDTPIVAATAKIIGTSFGLNIM